MNYKLSSLVERDKMSMINTIYLGGDGVLKEGSNVVCNFEHFYSIPICFDLCDLNVVMLAI